MLCISYLFAIKYHNMQEVNKADVKMLFFGAAYVYVYGCSVHTLLVSYGNDNWNWYFVIGIGILELVFLRKNWN